MSSFLLISVLLFVMAVLFAIIITGWRDAILERRDAPLLRGSDTPRISVIVPARNEEASIAAVLQDLFAQRYPHDRMEVLVIDDNSTDGTAALVRAMIPRWPQLQMLASAAPGKKAAITTGVHTATGDLVVLTDADVRFGAERVASIAAHWQAERSEMIVLPVFTAGHGLLGRMQEEEQAALLGTTMGSAMQGRAVLAYGANLAFTRGAFLFVGGYHGDRFASGDDLFLLQRFQRAGKRITCLFNTDALVTAKAAPSFRSFVQQRLRWAGKMRGAGVTGSLIGSLALLFPWALLYYTLKFDPVDSIGYHALYSAGLLAGAWVCWSLPVLALVRSVRGGAQQPSTAMSTLFCLIAFSCYAPLIASASLFLHPEWKGRRV